MIYKLINKDMHCVEMFVLQSDEIFVELFSPESNLLRIGFILLLVARAHVEYQNLKGKNIDKNINKRSVFYEK